MILGVLAINWWRLRKEELFFLGIEVLDLFYSFLFFGSHTLGMDGWMRMHLHNVAELSYRWGYYALVSNKIQNVLCNILIRVRELEIML